MSATTALEAVRGLDGVESLAVEADDQAQVLSVQSALGVALIQPLLGALAGAQVTSVTAREPTLEDAYVQLVSERDPRVQERPSNRSTAADLAPRSTWSECWSGRSYSPRSRTCCSDMRTETARCSLHHWELQ